MEIFNDPVGRVVTHDAEKREIYGLIAPYGERIKHNGKTVSFSEGSLNDIQPADVRLLREHDRSKVVGRMMDIEHKPEGAYATFKVANTPAGDELLTLVAEGLIDAFSPAVVVAKQGRDGAYQKIEAMPEVSAVFVGSFPSARILSIHSEETMENENVTEAVDLTPINDKLDEFAKQLDKLQALAEAPAGTVQSPPPAGWEIFAAQVEAEFVQRSNKYREAVDQKWEAFKASPEGLETFALADITGNVGGSGDVSGWMYEDYNAALNINVMDASRPLFANLGRVEMPKSGQVVYSVVSQHASVAYRGEQKSEIPSRAMIVQQADKTAAYLAGGLDIAIEAIEQSNGSLLQEVWNDLVKAYAKATELDPIQGAVPFFNTGAGFTTYANGDLTLTNFGTFAADLVEANEVVEDETGRPATKLAVTRAQWRTIVGFQDGIGRRLGAIGDESDFNAGLLSRKLVIDGVEVFPVKDLEKAALYNEDAVKAADSGPRRLEALNVALAGIDLGAIGRTIVFSRIPAGVVEFSS